MSDYIVTNNMRSPFRVPAKGFMSEDQKKKGKTPFDPEITNDFSPAGYPQMIYPGNHFKVPKAKWETMVKGSPAIKAMVDSEKLLVSDKPSFTDGSKFKRASGDLTPPSDLNVIDHKEEGSIVQTVKLSKK